MKLSTQRSWVMLLSAALGVVLFIYIIRLMQLQMSRERILRHGQPGTERSQVGEAAWGVRSPTGMAGPCRQPGGAGISSWTGRSWKGQGE